MKEPNNREQASKTISDMIPVFSNGLMAPLGQQKIYVASTIFVTISMEINIDIPFQ